MVKNDVRVKQKLAINLHFEIKKKDGSCGQSLRGLIAFLMK